MELLSQHREKFVSGRSSSIAGSYTTLKDNFTWGLEISPHIAFNVA
jgi:hypothetical protein